MLRRLLLLQDAARGLKVLHSMNVVHGDLVGLLFAALPISIPWTQSTLCKDYSCQLGMAPLLSLLLLLVVALLSNSLGLD